MAGYLSNGGNLFIFPERTRRTDGQLGRFNKGAFCITRKGHSPIQVLLIRNTDRLFASGRFWLNTCVSNQITVMRIGRIDPSRSESNISTTELMRRTRLIFEKGEGLANE